MKRNENGVPIPEADLPWKCGPVTGIVSDLPQGATISVTEQAAFHNADDREYAIHAANSFSQLVDIVRRLSDAVKQTKNGNPFMLGGMAASVAFDAAKLWDKIQQKGGE